MPYRLGVEDIEPDHWLAWALDLPGCFSAARTEEEAVARAPAAIADYRSWLVGHGRAASRADEWCDVTVVEVFHAFSEEADDYLVNAFFADDRRPLAREEIAEGLALLGCSRRDLLTVARRLSPEALDRPVADEARGSIAGILGHIAQAEWWYFDRLGLACPRAELPGEPFARLEQVRAWTVARLPELVDDERVTERVGEQWSARKVLRRTLWHERDHTRHIAKLARGRRVN